MENLSQNLELYRVGCRLPYSDTRHKRTLTALTPDGEGR